VSRSAQRLEVRGEIVERRSRFRCGWRLTAAGNGERQQEELDHVYRMLPPREDEWQRSGFAPLAEQEAGYGRTFVVAQSRAEDDLGP
jgi:hypothetical protein